MDPIEINTDLAALALFDPDVLQHRVRSKADWWRQGPLSELDELRQGRITLASIGKHGSYRIVLRLDAPPTEAEQALIVGELDGLGIVVESGQVFLGAGERLPGEGRGGRLSSIPGTGVALEVEPGEYSVTIKVLRWRHLDEHYDEDNEILPTAPPDFLVLVGPRTPLTFPEPLPALLDLIPKHEAKGSTSVPTGVRRRPSPSERAPRRGRTSRAPSEPRPYLIDRGPTVQVPEEVAEYSYEQVCHAFNEVLDPALRTPPGVSARLIDMLPFNKQLLSKEVMMPDLLKKVTTVRGQLRVLEAKLNAHKQLSDVERAALHTPITRAYQSLDALLDHLA